MLLTIDLHERSARNLSAVDKFKFPPVSTSHLVMFMSTSIIANLHVVLLLCRAGIITLHLAVPQQLIASPKQPSMSKFTKRINTSTGLASRQASNNCVQDCVMHRQALHCGAHWETSTEACRVPREGGGGINREKGWNGEGGQM